MSKRVAVLVGSLRKDSLSKKLAYALSALAPTPLQLELVEIGNLSLYNQDLEDSDHVPETWMAFRQQLAGCNGILFITPEYNRSIPAALKNAIDVGSRPYGQSIWNNKPAAIISLSPGAIGGFGANQHLRQSLACLNVPLLPQPEAYIGQAGSLFNEQDELVKEESTKFFRTFMDSFAHWLHLHSSR